VFQRRLAGGLMPTSFRGVNSLRKKMTGPVKIIVPGRSPVRPKRSKREHLHFRQEAYIAGRHEGL
ncbi:hypothetical protein NZA98_31620, partial [Escherichia coli]|nr:hypothetical protein [Escherichia coli]